MPTAACERQHIDDRRKHSTQGTARICRNPAAAPHQPAPNTSVVIPRFNNSLSFPRKRGYGAQRVVRGLRNSTVRSAHGNSYLALMPAVHQT